MKLLVFSESAAFRKQVEDLLAPTSHQAESRGLTEMLTLGKDDGFDATLTDYQSWQRCASMFRYFDCLELINQKPMMIFSKGRKTPPLKLRRARAFTTNCPVPTQNEDFQAALQQIAAA
jgi:hypothetical protein